MFVSLSVNVETLFQLSGSITGMTYTFKVTFQTDSLNTRRLLKESLRSSSAVTKTQLNRSKNYIRKWLERKMMLRIIIMAIMIYYTLCARH